MRSNRQGLVPWNSYRVGQLYDRIIAPLRFLTVRSSVSCSSWGEENFDHRSSRRYVMYKTRAYKTRSRTAPMFSTVSAFRVKVYVCEAVKCQSMVSRSGRGNKVIMK